MTAKGVRCEECRFCERGCWCRIKALRVAPASVRSCKVYFGKEAS